MNEKRRESLKGLLALSPLALFLAVYLATSLVIGDFYKIPVSAAFLIAAAFAVATTRGIKLEERIGIFSSGAGDRNVMMMIWIFVLAGAFSQTAKEIGAIDATVNLALRIIPGRMLFAGLFLTACFISISIGTSVGTIVALAPIAAGIAQQTGSALPFMTAVIVGGAFFGDNLSFISDTTIAATKAVDCEMKEKFMANLTVVIPAVVAVIVIYLIRGSGIHAVTEVGPLEPLKIIPYLMVLLLAILGMNVSIILSLGILANLLIGLLTGTLSFAGWLASIGEGIGGMGNLIIVTLLAGGVMALIRHNGGLKFITERLSAVAGGRRGAEFSIAALVSLANLCTANNTIAIITAGPIARDIAERFGLDRRRVASILDTFSCLIQGIIPYGAQLLMASALAGVSAVSIIPFLYYPFILGGVSLLTIFLGLPRGGKIAEVKQDIHI